MPSETNTKTAEPKAEDKPVCISREAADRAANNALELIAVRDELRAYKEEIKIRDIRDGNQAKLNETYDRALTALDTVIEAQKKLSGDKDALIKAQTDLIKTLSDMREKKPKGWKGVLGILGGLFLGSLIR